ncbi:hypothetical protein QC762_600767 [Podospora pseudocomata]|uniref:Uncharacterized protein n=1 Tax=Podospora pseudocomata TaxID=2093779 RepID=A0ABR0G7Y5_9PEZI|nr:hypothetical protein QC762_600767 [Podospora pseudocomata]
MERFLRGKRRSPKARHSRRVLPVIWAMIRYPLLYKPLGVPLRLLGAGSAFAEMKFLYCTTRKIHGNTRNTMTRYSGNLGQGPHAASVVVHKEIRMAWSTRLIGAPLNYGKSFLRTAIVDTTSPIVRSACVPARNLSDTTTYSDAFDDFWVPGVPGGEEGFESGPDGTVPLDASLLDLAEIVHGRDFWAPRAD